MNDMSGTDSALSAVSEVLSGYREGYRLIEGIDAGGVERYSILPARGLPRLMLPTEGAPMTAALKSFVGGRRWVGAAPSVMKVIAKTAGSTPVLSREVTLLSDSGAPSPVRTLLGSVLNRADFQLAFRLSVGRPNAKTVAMAIADDGEPLCFAKFGSEQMTNSLVEFEGRMLERFADRELAVVMPRVLHADVWAEKHHVLVTEPLRLAPLKRNAIEAHRAADAFTMASPITTSSLRESDYWSTTRERVRVVGAQDGKQHALLQRAVEFIESNWGDREFDFGYAHGDWSRPNLGLLDDVSSSGVSRSRVAALDWERCTECAPRGSDIAHFAVIENSSTSSNRLLDLELIASHARHYLDAIGRSPMDAKPLIALDLLEMVLRFSDAQAAGLPSTDSTFGPALQTAILQWAR